MPAVAFDTLRAKQALTAAGFPENQADAVVVMTGDALTEGVATKLDIGDLKGDISRLDAKIDSTAAQLRGDFKSEIAQLEVKLDGKIDKTADLLRGEIKSESAKIEAKIDARISGLESKILRISTALGAGTATVGLVAILVKLL